MYLFKAELIVGDQSGVIHIWDLKTDHNEQLIPEPDVSVNSVHIDPDASYMAAVNSSVSKLSIWHSANKAVFMWIAGIKGEFTSKIKLVFYSRFSKPIIHLFIF